MHPPFRGGPWPPFEKSCLTCFRPLGDPREPHFSTGKKRIADGSVGHSRVFVLLEQIKAMWFEGFNAGLVLHCVRMVLLRVRPNITGGGAVGGGV